MGRESAGGGRREAKEGAAPLALEEQVDERVQHLDRGFAHLPTSSREHLAHVQGRRLAVGFKNQVDADTRAVDAAAAPSEWVEVHAARRSRSKGCQQQTMHTSPRAYAAHEQHRSAVTGLIPMRQGGGGKGERAAAARQTASASEVAVWQGTAGTCGAREWRRWQAGASGCVRRHARESQPSGGMRARQGRQAPAACSCSTVGSPPTLLCRPRSRRRR